MAGIGCGIITFPMLIQHLLEGFGWRGCFLILSGVVLNLCVCGAIMRPMSSDKVSVFSPSAYVDTEQVVCVYRYSGILSTVLLLDVWFSFLCRH